MPVACRLVPRESGSGREYAVIDTGSGAVEFRHGSDTDACRRQAAAINANVEGSSERRNRNLTGGRAPESSLRVTKQTPLEYGELMRALEADGDAAALVAELDAVDSWRARYARARESGAPMGMVGRGWGAVDFFRAREIAARALEQLRLPRMDQGQTHDDFVPRTREGGIHAHRLNMVGRAELGGQHRHAFLFRGVMYMTEKDGAHEHDAAEGTATAGESAHEHAAFVPAGENGAMVDVQFASTTEHEHEKLVAVTVYDGLHEHTADVEGETVKTLTPEEFRAMFGEVAQVMIGGGPDGGSMVATEGLELRDWWAEGKGTAEAREALARYALDEAVMMRPMDCPLSVDSDAGGYYAIVGADYATIGEVCDVDLERALEAAIATVDREHPTVVLVGPPVGEGLKGGRVMRPLLYKFELTESGRARESIICTAVESFTDPWGGRVIEAADDLVWELVVLEFGLSDNGNFWPNTIGTELVRALEGVPIEEVQYDPLMRDHLPDRVLRRFPGGATGNFVGLVSELRVESTTGGKAPQGRALEAIAKAMALEPDQIVAASRGSIIGLARFDATDRGRNVDAQLRTAEAAGHLGNFLGVSIDVSHAPFTPLRVPGLRRPIRVRSAVDATDRRVVTLATRPSAGGTFLGSVAA